MKNSDRVWILFAQVLVLSLGLLLSPSSEATLVLGPEKAQPLTSDPYVDYQWHLVPNGQKSLQDIDDITPIEIRLSPLSDVHWSLKDNLMKRVVKIATIDSGVDPKHPDLVEQLGTGKSFLSPDPDDNILYEDAANHGTHVLSIIAAGIDNSIGVTGMTNKVQVIPLQVYDSQDEESSAEDRQALAGQGISGGREPLPLRFANAINFAVESEVDIIHLSAGWPRVENHPRLIAAVKAALAQDILIVAAAGNDGNDAQIYPCAFKGVVCVGSVSLDGQVSNFSNFGGHVDLYAPGEDILAAVPTFLSSDFFGITGYDFKSGTSQSAPMVTGTLAVMRGMWPELSRELLVEKLLGSSSTLPTGERFLDFEAATSEAEVIVRPRPDFKGLEFVVGQASESSLQLNIPWSLALSKTPKVKFSSLTKGYQLQSLKVSTDQIQVALSVESTRVDSRLSFQVEVAGEVFKHSVFHVRPLFAGSKSLMPLTEKLHPIALRSVANLTGDTKAEFWRTELLTEKDQKSLKLVVWSQASDSQPWEHKERTFQNVRGLQGNFLITRLQWQVGSSAAAGYVIGLIKASASGEGVVYAYEYLNSDLETLHSFEFVPEEAFPRIKSFDEYRFAAHDFKGQKILVPVFWDTYRTSEADANPDFFAFEDNPIRSHLFYFEPKNEGGVTKFVTRTVTHPRFEEQIRQEFGKDIRTDIVYQGPAQQQPGSYAKALELYFFLGRGVHGENLKLKLSDLGSRKFSIETLAGDQDYNLGRQPLTSAWNLTEDQVQWQPENLVVYSNFQGRSLLFEADDILENPLVLPKDRDAIRGVVKTFRGSGTDVVSMIQTKSYFKVQGQWNGKSVDRKQLLYRTTFMPGASFAQRLSPVLVGSEKRPSLLLDNTLAFSNTALVYQLHKNGEFFAPVRQAYQIPEGCLLKNVQFAAEGFHKVPVLCSRDSGIEVLWMVLED